MKIFVKVKPGAKKEKVEKTGDTNFKVSVKEPPEKGKANSAVTRALADYFGLKRADIKIVSGTSSKLKIIEVAERRSDLL